METFEFNEAGSTSIYLNATDELGAVPAPHSDLLTDAIRQQFNDPLAILRNAVQHNPFPEMERWLNALLASADWRLEIDHANPPMTGRAGYYFDSEEVLGATVNAAQPNVPTGYPEALRKYYSLVDQVDWMGCFCSGKLYAADAHTPLSDMPNNFHSNDLDPSSSFIWGDDPSGQMLVWCRDDRCGWISHSGRFHSLGTIADAIDWMFGKLNASDCPGIPHNAA